MTDRNPLPSPLHCIGRLATAAISAVSCRRSRTTLGLLLVIVLAAGGEGMPLAARGAEQARAEAVEARILPGAETRDAARAGTRVRIRCEGIAAPPRSAPRWIDPTTGGRPPVRAPDAA